jgi:acetate kinase
VSEGSTPLVLALNPGSSSLKAAMRAPQLTVSISVERLGTGQASLEVNVGGTQEQRQFCGGVRDAIEAIAAELTSRDLTPTAVAHRVVHGGPDHFSPTIVDESLLADLRSVIALAPLHLPGDLDSIEHAQRAWPSARHVACFDTGFHHALPEASVRLPVPEELVQAGIRRYGFHGLSVQSVLDARPDLDQVVVAHLGSGCSVTAVAGGRPRHTSMSLTPTSGMASGTRTGDLDPEIMLYLQEQHGYSITSLRGLLDERSGLAGIAGGRHDVRDLLGADASDHGASLALEIFFNSAAMAIASCATTLDQWQQLVFTGGVGENSAEARQQICRRLLALRGLPPAALGADSVSELTATGLGVSVVPADEQGVLDRLTRALLWPAV